MHVCSICNAEYNNPISKSECESFKVGRPAFLIGEKVRVQSYSQQDNSRGWHEGVIKRVHIEQGSHVWLYRVQVSTRNPEEDWQIDATSKMLKLPVDKSARKVN